MDNKEIKTALLAKLMKMLGSKMVEGFKPATVEVEMTKGMPEDEEDDEGSTPDVKDAKSERLKKLKAMAEDC